MQTLFHAIGYPLCDRHPDCRKIELALRVRDSSCVGTNKNATKAAIGYCDPNARRMYIPTLVNTAGLLSDGVTSDLFLTVWTYSGTNQGTVTKRILPAEKEKYAACAVTDGHGRVWVNAYVTGQHPYNPGNGDNHRAQMGAIAIDRVTGDPGSIAFVSLRLPQNLTYTSADQFFLGDYVYTQGAFYPDPNNPGNVNGLGSRIAMPTYTDLVNYSCSPASNYFLINLAGWK